ncbi:MAG: amino acid ABC transporter substrate-binding protein, partial [Mesorhizobium sp.]
MTLHMKLKSSIAAVLMLAGVGLATQTANADAVDDITKA